MGSADPRHGNIKPRPDRGSQQRQCATVRSPGSHPFDILCGSHSATRVSSGPEQTAVLLERWHGGDKTALEELLSRNIEWIEAFVRRRLGPQLRQKEETVDAVQDACVEILTYGPRFVVPDRDRFRALLGRMVENNLRDKHDYHTAKRRDMQREVPMPSQTVLRFGETPSQVAARDEHKQMTRLALDLLPPQEREAIVLREYDQLSFEDIATRVGLSQSGVRKCYQRGLVSLASKIKSLRAGLIDEALGDGS
tara:strand:- start:1214 stop:1969 length:756 start_codon:yes stop_codon:yes gene_type:complete